MYLFRQKKKPYSIEWKDKSSEGRIGEFKQGDVVLPMVKDTEISSITAWRGGIESHEFKNNEAVILESETKEHGVVKLYCNIVDTPAGVNFQPCVIENSNGQFGIPSRERKDISISLDNLKNASEEKLFGIIGMDKVTEFLSDTGRALKANSDPDVQKAKQSAKLKEGGAPMKKQVSERVEAQFDDDAFSGPDPDSSAKSGGNKPRMS